MENNLSELVYDSLKSSTEKLEEQKSAVADLAERVNSGRYSAAAIKDFNEQIAALRWDIRNAGDAAIDEARQLVDEFELTARKEMRLNPAELMPDEIALLNCGVRLTEADIEAMIERCAGNKTMMQIINRYAKERNIDIQQHGFPEFKAKMDDAQAVRGVLDYYRRWITEGNAMVMLDKFFNVGV